MRVRRPFRGARSDAGLSLIEVMVASALALVVGGLVTALVLGTQRQAAATAIRLGDVDSAQLGMDTLTRVLRTAVQPAQLQIGCTSCIGPASTSTALTDAEANQLQLFANLGDPTGPFLITFSAALNSRNVPVLTERIQRPDLNSAPNFTYTACTIGAAGCRISQRTLVGGLTWPIPKPIFTYRDNAGAELPIPAGQNDLSDSQLLLVDAIDISLSVKSKNRVGAGSMSSITRVALPNASTAVLATAVPMPGA